MPSSGYGIVDLIQAATEEEHNAKVRRLLERVALAQSHHMFVEWLESFVSAWEQTHDVDVASLAGVIEWDM